MIGEIPSFDVSSSNLNSPIMDENGFYKRVLEFIEFNLTSNYEIDILCYLVDPDGETMEAKLDRDGYERSLLKALEYYKQIEEYEICKRISNLINKHEL